MAFASKDLPPQGSGERAIHSNLILFLQALFGPKDGPLRPAQASSSELHQYAAFIDRLVKAGSLAPADAQNARGRLGDLNDSQALWNQ
jgi:hypothetical protein